jgi:hypothetical protein
METYLYIATAHEVTKYTLNQYEKLKETSPEHISFFGAHLDKVSADKCHKEQKEARIDQIKREALCFAKIGSCVVAKNL